MNENSVFFAVVGAVVGFLLAIAAAYVVDINLVVVGAIHSDPKVHDVYLFDLGAVGALVGGLLGWIGGRR